MNILLKIFILTESLLLLGVTTSSTSAEKEIILDDFSNGLSNHWKTKSFQGETEYRVGKEGDFFFLSASSGGTASGLYYDIEYSPEEYPILSWSWKIENTIKSGNARTKEGDDYAARVYVVFPSFLFWKTKALNYVWANKLERNQFTPNAFTGNAVMVAVESGDSNVGSWITERRNIIEDYKKAFGSLPPKVGTIAIMTDTDNTKESAKAYYGPIKILKE